VEEPLWRRVEACYHAVLELPLGDRDTFLASVEPEVRREVLSLLAHDGGADALLERPARV
jgi:hypothetical protein